jgi:hypothetical protein
MSTNPIGEGGSANNQIRGFYKVVGTPSGGAKTVTATITGTQAIQLFVAEYGDGAGSPTWAIDGSQVGTNGTATRPVAGSIVVTGTNTVISACTRTSGSPHVAGTDFTVQATQNDWGNCSVEDRITTSAATYAVDLTSPTDQNWGMQGIAFTATVGGGATVSTITGTTVTEGTNVVFTVNMSGTGGGSFAYSWSGTAAAADYTTTLTSGMFTTTGGSGSVVMSGSNVVVDSTVTAFTVSVPTSTDTLDEDSETVRLVLGSVTASSGTITDDDTEPNFTGTTSGTVDPGDPLVITYTASAVSGRTITRTLTVTDGTATGGGVDYTSTITDGMFATTSGAGTVTISGSTVTIPAGVGAFTLTIPTTA